MKFLGAAWKLWRVLMHTIVGWCTVRFRFAGLDATARRERVQSWSRQMLALLGIKLVMHGAPPAQGPLLLVANHISWLDILVMNAARHSRFVSKSDVRHWPLFGMLATGAGTLYIERESRRDAMRVVHRMADSLRAGDIVAIFPEGTTSDGLSLLPFHANLIQAAISAGAPVQPVALRFIDTASGKASLAPCYIGDDTLLGSIWRTLTGPRFTAVVSYGEPEQANGRNRRAWVTDLHAAVQRLRQS